MQHSKCRCLVMGLQSANDGVQLTSWRWLWRLEWLPFMVMRSGHLPHLEAGADHLTDDPLWWWGGEEFPGDGRSRQGVMFRWMSRANRTRWVIEADRVWREQYCSRSGSVFVISDLSHNYLILTWAHTLYNRTNWVVGIAKKGLSLL